LLSLAPALVTAAALHLFAIHTSELSLNVTFSARAPDQHEASREHEAKPIASPFRNKFKPLELKDKLGWFKKKIVCICIRM
jgi:hypothetical protein